MEFANGKVFIKMPCIFVYNWRQVFAFAQLKHNSENVLHCLTFLSSFLLLSCKSFQWMRWNLLIYSGFENTLILMLYLCIISTQVSHTHTHLHSFSLSILASSHFRSIRVNLLNLSLELNGFPFVASKVSNYIVWLLSLKGFYSLRIVACFLRN